LVHNFYTHHRIGKFFLNGEYLVALTARDIATILASIRLFQHEFEGLGNWSKDFIDAALDLYFTSEDIELPTVEYFDALCQQINISELDDEDELDIPE